MSKTNDMKIMNLKKEIEEKEDILVKPIFSPLTNCNITIDSTRYNLHVIKKDELTFLIVHFNMYLLSATNLEISCKDFKIQGFSILDWLHDFNNRLLILNFEEEQKKLKSMKETLKKLLSDDKKTELALDEIENDLKMMF